MPAYSSNFLLHLQIDRLNASGEDEQKGQQVKIAALLPATAVISLWLTLGASRAMPRREIHYGPDPPVTIPYELVTFRARSIGNCAELHIEVW